MKETSASWTSGLEGDSAPIRIRLRFTLATREFTCGLALASKTEHRCLAMTHPRVSAAKGSVSSLDHHGGTRTLGYKKKKNLMKKDKDCIT